MNWINLGYAANESVSVREDFKLVRIGKDFQDMSKASSEKLRRSSNSELTRMCVVLFNEEKLDSLENY